MPKTITSIGDLGCCILGVNDAGGGLGSLDEMMSISAADDDAINLDDPGEPQPAVSDFDPVFIPATGPVAEAIPEPGPGGSLTPKAAGWARGDGSYVVQSGDTLSGLARIYLGDASKFPDIWARQSAAYRAKRASPNNLVVGDILAMPPAAVLKAQQMGVFRPKVPSSSSTPAPTPAAPIATAPIATTAVPKPAAAAKPSHKVALGLGSALAAGLGLLVFGKPHTAAPARRKKASRRRAR
jgi:hypothetical protein